MVQGLGFLSKKSWHTKNLANQEKVWMAEQRKEAEANKTKELAKQIQQEREQEELDRISGKKTVMDRGIDWMYQGGTTGDLAKEDAEKRAEEFLLGKEYVGEGAAQGDFDEGNQQEGIHSAVAQASEPQPEQASVANVHTEAWLAEPSVKDRNENFRLRVEDPMFVVSKQEREKNKKYEDTKALYERVVGPVGYGSADDDEGHRISKRERKKQKKHKSRRRDDDHKRSRHRRHRSRSRSRSRSNDRQHRHRRKRRSYSSSLSRSRSRSRSEDSHDRHRHRRTGRHSRHHEERSKRRGIDDYSNRDSKRSRREDSSRYDGRKKDRREEYNRDSKPESRYRRDERKSYKSEDNYKNETKRDNQSRNEKPKKIEGYGLKGSHSSSLKAGDLGPDRALLQKKREEQEAERKRIREVASSRRRRTGDARAQALQEMRADAMTREKTMQERASYKKNPEEYEAPTKGSASFLTDITSKTHGISGGDTASLSARVAQNRHTNQRLHDSFL